jgi:hypothetical protein
MGHPAPDTRIAIEVGRGREQLAPSCLKATCIDLQLRGALLYHNARGDGDGFKVFMKLIFLSGGHLFWFFTRNGAT